MRTLIEIVVLALACGMYALLAVIVEGAIMGLIIGLCRWLGKDVRE